MIDWGEPYRWFYAVHVRGLGGSEFVHESSTDRRHIAIIQILDHLKRTNPSLWRLCQRDEGKAALAGVTVLRREKIA